MISVAKTSEHQTEAKLRVFLPVASNFKAAQFLSSNHTLNFPNLRAFQKKYNQNHPTGQKNNQIIDFPLKWIIDIDCCPGHLNP